MNIHIETCGVYFSFDHVPLGEMFNQRSTRNKVHTLYGFLIEQTFYLFIVDVNSKLQSRDHYKRTEQPRKQIGVLQCYPTLSNLI